MERVWELMGYQLHFIRHAYQIKILGFVLMANHFHLLVLAPNENLSEAMAFFMRETSRTLSRTSSRINRSYGGRFFRSNIKSHHYFLNAYKYIYRNPVHAGLVARAEDYGWSTLRGLLGMDHTIIPVEEDTTLYSDVEGTLRWLNSPVKENDWQCVRKALRRSEFKFAKDRIKRCPHVLETELI